MKSSPQGHRDNVAVWATSLDEIRFFFSKSDPEILQHVVETNIDQQI